MQSTVVFNRLVAGRVCRKTPRFCYKPCLTSPMFLRRCLYIVVNITVSPVSLACPSRTMYEAQLNPRRRSHDVCSTRCGVAFRTPFVNRSRMSPTILQPSATSGEFMKTTRKAHGDVMLLVRSSQVEMTCMPSASTSACNQVANHGVATHRFHDLMMFMEAHVFCHQATPRTLPHGRAHRSSGCHPAAGIAGRAHSDASR